MSEDYEGSSGTSRRSAGGDSVAQGGDNAHESAGHGRHHMRHVAAEKDDRLATLDADAVA